MANPVGRPSKYSRELAEEIGKRMSQGIGMPTLCKADDMPDRATLCRWLIENEEFRGIVTQAREASVEFELDEAREIADDTTGDTVKVKTERGNEFEKVNHENIQRSKLRVETRFNRAKMLSPKKYGVNQDINLRFPEALVIKGIDGQTRETLA